MAKTISILGSTGSIGTQTLEAARNLGIKVAGLAAGSNIDLLAKQIEEFSPDAVSVASIEMAEKLAQRFGSIRNLKIYFGDDGLRSIATLEQVDTVVVSVVGIAGLMPTLEAIKRGKDIALANKETLVVGGDIVMKAAAENNVKILPLDSEHSAIFQCLQGNDRNDVKRIILTASGGPFRGRRKEALAKVTVGDTLAHPKWNMGKKVTIDAATLMNKGLEVIEAKWLFNLEPEQINVIIHPQSIIHSMVEYADNSVIAQLGAHDMRIPIQYALSYPERINNPFDRLDFKKENSLTFEEPDFESFPCLAMAYKALGTGGTAPAAMNAANEVAVEYFLDEKIGFNDIPDVCEIAIEKHNFVKEPTINDIIETDIFAREKALEWIARRA